MRKSVNFYENIHYFGLTHCKSSDWDQLTYLIDSE